MMKLLLTLCALVACTSASDCDSVSSSTRTFVDQGIANNKVFILGLSYCPWCTLAKNYVRKMGFMEGHVSYNNIDKMSNVVLYDVARYAKCLTGEGSFPRVWINQKLIGGSFETRMAFWTGAGIKTAYDAGLWSEKGYKFKLWVASREFVKYGVQWSSHQKVFMLSKVYCPHCHAAKACLKQAGVHQTRIQVHEINDFQTHDEIKLYKQELTGSPFTPLLAYNGKVLKDVGELKKIFGCTDDSD